MSENPILEKNYDPRQVEPEMFKLWEQAGAFASKPNDTPHERTFTVVIPPPNVTGALHLGHALNNTLQDILVRYHRMRGFNTLWQPGTDHAGIATQAVVERRIRESEGKTRHEIGREELVRRIWEWKVQYEERILSQLKLMGCSCDWDRVRFTLDKDMARAVRQMFFKLFKDGLITRGKRLVNWDTQLQTAVSDDEVYYENVKGHFWHFKYPVIDPKTGEPDHVIIATTRPETMLGDTAVAVNSDPERYLSKQEATFKEQLTKASEKEQAEVQAKLEALAARRETHLAGLIKLRDMAEDGRMLLLPLVERKIPLICDDWAKPDLGSGCVKITPAHDPNDYEVGLRHNLPMINVMTADGKIARIVEPEGDVNSKSGDYEGLTFAIEGRAKVVADIEARELLHEIEDHDVELGHSDRSKLPIEPYLSDQWFVKTGNEKGVRLGDGTTAPGLAQAAMDSVEDGRIQVFPSRYAKSYLDWLGEKRDWCISRQLWWGHRIPVWSYRISLDGRNAFLNRMLRGHGEMPAEDAAAFEFYDKCRVEFPDHTSCKGLKQTISTRGLPAEARFRALKARKQGEHVLTPAPIVIEGRLYVAILDGFESTSMEAEAVGFVRDEDVLDTWFSSALWPMSTLGWPEETEHFKQYYPGSVLVTARDIITNWVARMVMFGLYATGKVPFDRVYITPKILDGRGETMSKSKGNGVDPVDVIHTHGADALRYTMADMTTETQDIRMPVEYICPKCGKLTDQAAAIKLETQDRKSRGEKFERKLQPADCHRVKCGDKECGKEFATQWASQELKDELGLARDTSEKFDVGRNFCNKIWNAARFAFMNLENAPCESLNVAELPPEDRWILARLSQTIRRYHECIANYQFSASVKELRDFFWDSLCDWYIELTKPRLTEPQGGTKRIFALPSACTTAADAQSVVPDPAKQVLAFCMDQVLRLWHPTMPFITERLWQQLNTIAPNRGLPDFAKLKTDQPLIVSEFPPVEGYPILDDEGVLATFAELQYTTRGVRELRSSCDISPKQKVKVTVAVPSSHQQAFKANSHIIRHMAGISELVVDASATRPKNAGSISVRNLRIFVHDISDDEADRKRTAKSLEQLQKQISGKESKLSNEKFVSNAKPEVVQAERERLDDMLVLRNGLQEHLAELGG